VAAATGGFAGGLLAQLSLGALFLKKIVNKRCTVHSEKLRQLEWKIDMIEGRKAAPHDP
jgi:hypothetical protein